MPHLVIEYSDNLEVESLLQTTHESLCGHSDIKPETLKSRAIKFESYIVGNSPSAGFVKLSLHLLDGRSNEVHSEILSLLKADVEAFVGTQKLPVAQSIQLIPINRELYSTLNV